jgi:hypothetical protein
MNFEPRPESLSEYKFPPGSVESNCVSYKPLWKKFLIPTVVFLWPFIYFWRQVIPFKGQYVAIGNDFNKWSYVYKIYLLDHLSHFHIPLWSPAEAAGFPFYSSPLTQTFYPLNLFLVIFYHLAGGYTRLDHQIFTILGISIFALGLFFWLRQLNLNWRAVLFATLVMSISFKMAEILRFPNAVHTAAWYPWILFAITSILQKQSLKELAGHGFLLVFFLICFLTGGYPYYIYYSLFLFPPYFVLFLIPNLRSKLFINQQCTLRNSIITLLLSITFSGLITQPYLYQVNRLLKNTVARGGGNFNFSTKLAFNYVDTIGSLIFPPIANTEGWYYFGILGILLILLYYFSGLLHLYSSNLKPTELEKQKNLYWYQDHWVKILFLVWIGTITYITYGKDSYLFIFLWKYMPFFSRLRAWSRMNIILVPIISWLLAISYTHFEELISQSKAFHNRRRAIYIITGVYVAIFIIQIDAFINKFYNNYWTWYFRDVASKDIFFIIFGFIAFAITSVLLKLASKIRFHSPRLLSLVLTGFILLSALDMRSVGASMWIYPSTLANTKRSILNVAQLNMESFKVRRIEAGTLSLSSAFIVGNKDINRFNWYFNRYVKFIESTESQLTYRRKLLGSVDGKKLYFSKSIAYPTIKEFIDDAIQFNNFERLISYTGDKLVLEVNVPKDGYLSFIDNWDSGWEATVDSKLTKIELLFGLFKSVRLSAGKHQVVFAYRPKFFKIFAEKLN